MKISPVHPRRWAVAATPVLLVLVGALVSSAQIDLTGYWAFRVKDGGVNFFQLQQTGENVTSVPSGGRGGTLAGTLRDGKLHLVTTFNTPAPAPRPRGARRCTTVRSRTPIGSQSRCKAPAATL